MLPPFSARSNASSVSSILVSASSSFVLILTAPKRFLLLRGALSFFPALSLAKSMHDQTTPLFSQSGEMLSFSRGGGTSLNTTNKYIYTRAYEKTTKRALFLSLVLSLFLLLLLLRARVFPLNKYVVTLGKDENSFLLLSNARSETKTRQKERRTQTPE